MHALVLPLLLSVLSELILAQPHARHQYRHAKRILEEVVDIEVEVWTTVTLPAPSGWHHSDHPNEAEKTSSYMKSTLAGTATTGLLDSSVSSGAKKNHPPSVTTDSGAFVMYDIESNLTPHISATSGSGTEAFRSYTKPSTSSSSITLPKVPISSAKGGEKKEVIKLAERSSMTIAATAAATSAAAPGESSRVRDKPAGGKYPFSALVAFGDNLSDNGNGSYAHHVADQNNPDNTIYGARTWTNAQVAVSYLTDLLSVPMNQDFAFGHAWGGKDAGATLDNTMYVSDFHNTTVAAELGCPGAPPASQQVSSYVSSGVDKAALHFLWIGNNDVDMVGFYQQETFNKNLTTGMTKIVQQLLDAGAPYVFVPNIYPKQLAPVVEKWYNWTSQSDIDAFGAFINNANSALKTTLVALGDRVIYYDANAFLTEVWDNAGSYGISNAKDTNGYPAFCDGDPDQTSGVKSAIAAGTINQQNPNNWGICVDDHKQDQWYWMQYLDMTSHVHELLAGDMNKVIAAHFA